MLASHCFLCCNHTVRFSVKDFDVVPVGIKNKCCEVSYAVVIAITGLSIANTASRQSIEVRFLNTFLALRSETNVKFWSGRCPLGEQKLNDFYRSKSSRFGLFVEESFSGTNRKADWTIEPSCGFDIRH